MTEWLPLPLADRARATFLVAAVSFLVSLAFGAAWWALLVAGALAVATWFITAKA